LKVVVTSTKGRFAVAKFLPALIVIILQMAEAPEVVALPKGLKHWINSFKMPTCVLVRVQS
jgi:hypothetical protein